MWNWWKFLSYQGARAGFAFKRFFFWTFFIRLASKTSTFRCWIRMQDLWKAFSQQRKEFQKSNILGKSSLNPLSGFQRRETEEKVYPDFMLHSTMYYSILWNVLSTQADRETPILWRNGLLPAMWTKLQNWNRMCNSSFTKFLKACFSIINRNFQSHLFFQHCLNARKCEIQRALTSRAQWNLPYTRW